MEHRFTAGEIAKLSGLSKQTILFMIKRDFETGLCGS